MDIVTDVQASGHHLDSPEKSSSPESHRLMGSSQSANQYTIDAPGIATRQVTSTEVGASNPLQDQTALERSQEAVLPYQGLVTNRESRINLDQAGRSEHQKVLTEFNAKHGLIALQVRVQSWVKAQTTQLIFNKDFASSPLSCGF
ncbi:uncharacterized protein PGTG_16431 [Puccinia graminis f. sp. tritici CRL 75-36-700-3]|uniref:Uncharacterized protein n=1 Tax=Puccinia graminis f. sp. tritici (strain CRL 75-36-700-3 / race SCCL) TaxID=418459 RepID=E3L3W5_PUCGT|nr:uncharacterized protein PGTG_16431 [Puccinia graminis f. sp. tritici CRL 75-36-700-3]EFP91240.2 hypothetical protein PGTG_16431 [Puccinia graminis f. sp. tritici CRL 75-36-700-3]